MNDVLADAIRGALDDVGIRLNRHDETRLIRQATFLLDAWGYRLTINDTTIALDVPESPSERTGRTVPTETADPRPEGRREQRLSTPPNKPQPSVDLAAAARDVADRIR